MRRQLGIFAAVGLVVAGAGAMTFFLVPARPPLQADPDNAEQVAAGRSVYVANCASCHGAKLEGQPNWKERKPDGKLPAPPHDETGHTWHHPDQQLFDIVKRGVAAIVPNYPTDMIGFGGRLSDQDIWNVIAYIKSTWPADVRVRQAEMTHAAAAQAGAQ